MTLARSDTPARRGYVVLQAYPGVLKAELVPQARLARRGIRDYLVYPVWTARRGILVPGVYPARAARSVYPAHRAERGPPPEKGTREEPEGTGKGARVA